MSDMFKASYLLNEAVVTNASGKVSDWFGVTHGQAFGFYAIVGSAGSPSVVFTIHYTPITKDEDKLASVERASATALAKKLDHATRTNYLSTALAAITTKGAIQRWDSPDVLRYPFSALRVSVATTVDLTSCTFWVVTGT